MVKEFVQFIKEFNVVSLAIAVVVGVATTSLVDSFVKDIFMPFTTPFLAAESWQTATVSFGEVTLSYGAFFAELLNFVILAFLIFIIVKKLLKIEAQKK